MAVDAEELIGQRIRLLAAGPALHDVLRQAPEVLEHPVDRARVDRGRDDRMPRPRRLDEADASEALDSVEHLGDGCERTCLAEDLDADHRPSLTPGSERRITRPV